MADSSATLPTTVQIPDPPPSLVQQQEDPSPRSPKPSTLQTPTPAHVQSPEKDPSPVLDLRAGSGRHPSYRGIRSRSGKWVSEIREPRKTTRIWLGTYPTPEMAATAYDVAAIALKGPDTDLNFPDMLLWYPKVASTSATDIRAAAASAAASRLPKPDTGSSNDSKRDPGKPEDEGIVRSTCMGQEFIDVEEFLNFPNLMVDMAGGMLVSPPSWINSPPSEDSPENSDAEPEGLWNYT